MVQVLPQVPSFGSQLARTLTDAGINVADSFQRKKDQKIIQTLPANASPMDIFQAYGKLSEGQQKAFEPLISQLIRSPGSSGAPGSLPMASDSMPLEQLLFETISGQNQSQQMGQALGIDNQFQQVGEQQPITQLPQQEVQQEKPPSPNTNASRKTVKELEMQKAKLRPYLNSKERKEEAKSLLQDLDKKINLEKGREGIQEIFNEMIKDLSVQGIDTGIGISPATALGINRKGVRNRSRFNTYGPRIEKILRELINPTGALSEERFKYIVKHIPKASESQQDIAGKLQGLSRDFSDDGIPIDVSGLEDLIEKWDGGKSSKPSIESFIGKRR